MMDNRTAIAAVAVVAVVIVIGCAAYFMLQDNGNNDGGDDSHSGESIPVTFEFNNEIRLAIFGNANGDDYLDQKDVDLLQSIIDGEIEYDPVQNCFADTNADGQLDQSDVDLLQKFVNKEEGTMHYYDAGQNIASIQYPLDGSIAVYHVYPLDACIILGLYDDVVGMSNQGFLNSIGKDPARYPGIGTTIKNIGTPHEDCEALISSGANVYIVPWDFDNSNIKTIVDASGLDLQIVQLPMSSNGPDIVDQYGSLLMLGVMFQKEDRAYEYIEMIDGIQETITEGVSQISDRYTFITPFTGDSNTEVSLDTSFTNGSMPGDVYTISKLPMDSVNLVVDSGCPTVSIEWVIATDPDVIFVILFDDYTHSVEDVQKELDEAAELFKDTTAYKNGMIFGVNYYNIANYAGIPTLPLLASMIWPDLFDEEESIQLLQEYYEKYTAYENPDVTQMGNALVYQMSKAAA